MIFYTKAFKKHYLIPPRPRVATPVLPVVALFIALALLSAFGYPAAPAPPTTAPTTAPTPSTPPPAAHARYTAAREEAVEEILEAMSLEEKAGQLLMVALTASGDGAPLTKLDETAARRLAELEPGGIVLYGGNVEDVQQLVRLIADAQDAVELPLFVGIDEEGGLVSRLRHLGDGEATHLPPAATLGATGEPLLAYRAGRALARELRSLGFNMNFAPVLDVAAPGENPFLESRTLSGDPGLVSRLGIAFLRGMQYQGVSAAVKHFPGHGRATEDSHYGNAVATASVDELARRDWVPFRAAVEAGTDAFMVGHIVVPELTGERRPATVSREALTEAARGELGFDGLLISDSVTMAGLAKALDGTSAAREVIAAGADIVLTPASPVRAREELVGAVAEGHISEERIDASVRRVLRAKIDRGVLVPAGEVFERRFPHLEALDPREVLASPEHRRLVEAIERRAAAAADGGTQLSR
ncbi:MAG: glycoside hydrolase family 3 protein [Spirochaetaceae bacterium]